MKTTVLAVSLILSLFAYASPPSIQGQNLLTDKNVQIDTTDKKGLVVIFMSAKCPCSNSHVVEVKDLSIQHKDFNFVVVHSNAEEDLSVSKPYFEKAGFSFPVIEDKDFKLADQYKALKTPHVFILDSTGKTVYQGGVSNSKDCQKADRLFLREALEDLSANKAVRTPEGRTLGCVISRGEKNVF